MPLPIFEDSCPFVLSPAFFNLLNDEIKKAGIPPTQAVILNFRDPDYSSERGGYHPVEISITKQGIIQYVTDFAYVGRPPYAELAKEIDFDFSLGILQHFGREFPIVHGRALFALWQRNFVSYYRSGVFTVEIEAI